MLSGAGWRWAATISTCSVSWRLSPRTCARMFTHLLHQLYLALMCRLEDVYLKALDLDELMDRARQVVVGRAQRILKDDPEAQLPVRLPAAGLACLEPAV